MIRIAVASTVMVAVVAVCLSQGDAARADGPAGGQRYALLVGVQNYKHAKLREPDPLKYPVADVTDLGTQLAQHGYTVSLLTDKTGAKDAALQPTRENIERQLQEILRKAGEKDTVLIGLAGHGLQFSGKKDAYFCPIDARPFASETDSLVSITKIYEQLDRSFAGVKVVLVDACRNDPDPARGRGLDADSAPPPPKGVAVLFSCSAGQRAFETDQLKHGVFFHYVLEGLKGEAKDDVGDVTFEQLSIYVRKRVPPKVRELTEGRSQQLPNVKADLAGEPPILMRVATTGSGKSDKTKSAQIGKDESKSLAKSANDKKGGSSGKSGETSKPADDADDAEEKPDSKTVKKNGKPFESVNGIDYVVDKATRNGGQVKLVIMATCKTEDCYIIVGEGEAVDTEGNRYAQRSQPNQIRLRKGVKNKV